VPELSIVETVVLLAAIAAVAFLYSSVGHGGATGYLAVAAMLGLSPVVARPGALWMNCFVAGIAFWRFRRVGYFDGKIFAQIAVASIPLRLAGQPAVPGGARLLNRSGVTLLAAGCVSVGLGASQRMPTHKTPALPSLWLRGGGLGCWPGSRELAVVCSSRLF